MATITSAASGNWGAGATWVGGVAPNYLTDIAVIASGHKVTIATSATIPATTVGPPANGVSTTELEIASGVTVTLAGNLMINPGNNASAATLTTVTHQAGSTLNLATFKYGNTGGGNVTGSRYKSVINGISGNRANITGSSGSQIKIMSNVDWAYTYNLGIIDWNYVTISGVDSGTETNFLHGRLGFNLTNVLTKNSAVFVLGDAGATYNFAVQNCDFRTLTSRFGSYITNNPLVIAVSNSTGGTRVFKSNTFYAAFPCIMISGITIEDSIFDQSTLIFQTASNVLIKNCAFFIAADAGFSILDYSGVVDRKIENCIFHYENNAHGMGPSTGAGAYLKNSVITASGGAADPLYGGDNQDWEVSNNLMIGVPGSAINYTWGKFYNNTISMATDPIYIQEAGVSANWRGDSIFQNNLFLDVTTYPTTRTYFNPVFALTPPYTTDTKRINYIDYNAWVPRYNNQGGTFNKYWMNNVCQYSIRYDGQDPVKKDLRLNSQLYGTSAATFEVEIVDGTASPNTYKWRKNGGTWSSPIALSTSWVLISAADNIYAQWGSTTGHTALDNYKFDYVFLTQGQLGFGSQDTALTLTPAQVQFKWDQDSPAIPRDIDVYRNYLLSTTGSIRSDWFIDAVKRNGFDRSGTTATFNVGFDPTVTLTWIKAGWETTSSVLATGGLGGTYIGAFVPLAPATVGSNIWDRIFHSRIFK
jgi:hypothetical protein